MSELRIGLGWDSHPFASVHEDRPLVLGGVAVPHERGLLGHSDADVLTHALIDALLGAAGLGDIGSLFPDGDPAYKNASSIALLKHVASLVRNEGWRLVNADCVLVCERPKISPYRSDIISNLARNVDLEVDCISLKGKTAERMGAWGREEGIGGQCVCLLRRAR